MIARGTEGNRRVASRLEFWWLCALVLSFYYELSLFELTPYDRINPRLFDIVMIFGALFVGWRFKRLEPLPTPFKLWAGIVGTYVVCSVLWTVGWLPPEYAKFSLFFAFKYVVGLYAVFLVVKIPLSSKQKKLLHHIILIGGAFVGLYAIWEYNQNLTFRSIAGGKKVFLNPGTLLGPLGHTYFHIAMICTLSFAMSLSLLLAAKRLRWKVLYLLAAVIGVWPAFFCGSRAAVAAVAIVLVWFFSTSVRSRMVLITLVALFTIFVEAFSPKIGIENNLTAARFERMEDVSQNSIYSRVTLSGYSLDMYRSQGLLVPLIGGGFGVVPHSLGNGALRYRVGYGIHNAYLFPLEQGGLVAFFLFLFFIGACWVRLKKMKRSNVDSDKAFAIGVSAFFVGLLCAAWTGQVFWLGNGTENLTTYIVMLLLLATKQASLPRSMKLSISV